MTKDPGANDHPRRIGPYRILSVLGEGGMGTVYEAEQSEPVQRTVAIKLIRASLRDAEIVERFAWERRALALMSHDSIAKVYECGATETGQPYMVMERVWGEPLSEFCRRTNLPLDTRLRLLRRLCDAIQHAHQKGVVHRDLKPSNVLVVAANGQLRIKVIDFGLAKSRAGVLATSARRDDSEWGGGTPGYMAPEQTYVGDDIDTRADVYSLGAMLYEALVGSLPLPYEQLHAAADGDWIKVLRSAEPDRPSVRLDAQPDRAAAIAAERRLSPRALRRVLRSDLDHVVMQALAKDREKRLASPAELAAELQRFLAHEPLLAAPRTPWYRFTKFARRNRGRLATAGAVLVMATLMGVNGAVHAAAQAKTVAEFRQLEGVVSLRRLDERDRALQRAVPANVAALQELLGDAKKLVARRTEFVAAREAMRGHADAPADGTGTPRFESPSQELLFDELRKLDAGLERVETTTIPAIDRRLTWAASVGAATSASKTAPVSWAQARQAIATSPRYADSPPYLGEDAVVGLVPLGENPNTGLWEFYHLRSAWSGYGDASMLAVPARGADGQIVTTSPMGIVFVLLPGARYAPNGGRGAVELAPFLLASHELTRGQWLRLGGAKEVFWHTDNEAGERHPAESMDWTTAHDLLAGHGLVLPTEVQWEYACTRGGPLRNESSRAAANLRNGEHRKDSFDRIAPVGSFAADACGLFDMHGNVAEWCQDNYAPATRPLQKGDGLRLPDENSPNKAYRMSRGSSFNDPASNATDRTHSYPSSRSALLGVRPAMRLGATARR